ncbi:LEA type 2 family protein [Halorientalis salina]|uniref:LEA type 2 family protein n=1 Tax=Halorientalis salina TaxID=2932266 RepID=UPI0010AB9AD4|nr:LEA type 2 family protein [Halorientalis salina]
MSRLTETFLGSTVRVVSTALLGVVVLIALAFLLGLLGVPEVASVQNSFGPVNESTTTIQTDLVVSNPNPVGVSLAGTTVNYTVLMNDVTMASGQKEGVRVGRGNSTLSFTTSMRNDRIPAWWRSHIANDEQTQVVIDARVTSSTLGGREVALPQKERVETDIISQFNSEETRPIDANRPLVDDPVLYVNETSAQWDTEGLSEEETPIEMSFDVYNPKPWPYAVSEVGYTITMNDVTVGQGSSEDVATVLPGQTERIRTRTAMQNENLDEWWVSHLERNQVTDVEIDFYLVVDPQSDLAGVGEFRIPLEAVDYERTIETDIFGTKNGSAANGTDEAGDDGSMPMPDSTDEDEDAATPTGETTDSTTDTQPETATRSDETTTEDDGGLLG